MIGTMSVIVRDNATMPKPILNTIRTASITSSTVGSSELWKAAGCFMRYDVIRLPLKFVLANKFNEKPALKCLAFYIPFGNAYSD